MGLFDFLGGNQHEPLRGDLKVRVRLDPETDQPVEEPQSGEDVRMAPNGAPYRVQVSYDRFHDCGHAESEPLGGRCRCGRTSCVHCFTRCAATQAPLCPACVRFTQIGGQMVPLTEEKANEHRRRRIAGRVGRSLLGFFVEFPSHRDKRS